jgi:methylated-DNA-[protein]-cysteine S-methyltransferase
MNPRIVAQTRIETPLGPLTLAATADGLAGAWFDGQAHHPGPITAPADPEQPHLARAAREFQAYWHGGAQAFGVPLDAAGTDFQRSVWRALCEIEPGRTCSYGEVARRIGRPHAVRAVGAAVGRNPVSIVVPCHRVVGGDGSLTGYAGGLARKQALLAHEGAAAAA